MLPTKPCFYTGLFVAFKPGFIYIGTKVFKLPCSCARTATLFLISSSHIIDFQGGREYYTITTKSTGESPTASFSSLTLNDAGFWEVFFLEKYSLSYLIFFQMKI